MSVNFLVVRLRCNYFRYHIAVTVYHSHIVHHLGKSENFFMLKIRINIFVAKPCTAFVKGGGRHARRQHKININRQILSALYHIINAVKSHNICYFVWVGNNRCSAMRNNSLCKFTRSYHCTFKVNMRINKSRKYNFSVHINFFFSLVFAYACYKTVCNGNITLQKLI